MNRERLTVSFFINSGRAINGYARLQCRTTFRGLQKTFSTGINVPIEEWNGKLQVVAGRSKRAKTLNDCIQNWEHNVISARDELISERQFFDTGDIINRARGASSDVRFLIDTYQKYIETHKLPFVESGDLSKTLLLKHKRTQSALASYCLHEFERKDIDIRRIDHAFVKGLFVFLRTEENFQHNTGLKHMQRVREILKFCSSNGWINKNPFNDFRFRFKVVDRPFLTEEELDLLLAYNPSNSSLKNVLDVFLLACYTGLSYTDIRSLRVSNITLEKDTAVIKIKRKKTGVESYIPLLPEATNIIQKYHLHPERIADGKVVPVRSNQKTNAYLKVLLDSVGISKPITFHCARHTFATYILNKNVSQEVVAELLGHKDLRSTRIYAKMLRKRVHNELSPLFKPKDDDIVESINAIPA